MIDRPANAQRLGRLTVGDGLVSVGHGFSCRFPLALFRSVRNALYSYGL